MCQPWREVAFTLHLPKHVLSTLPEPVTTPTNNNATSSNHDEADDDGEGEASASGGSEVLARLHLSCHGWQALQMDVVDLNNHHAAPPSSVQPVGSFGARTSDGLTFRVFTVLPPGKAVPVPSARGAVQVLTTPLRICWAQDPFASSTRSTASHTATLGCPPRARQM